MYINVRENKAISPHIDAFNGLVVNHQRVSSFGSTHYYDYCCPHRTDYSLQTKDYEFEYLDRVNTIRDCTILNRDNIRACYEKYPLFAYKTKPYTNIFRNTIPLEHQKIEFTLPGLAKYLIGYDASEQINSDYLLLIEANLKFHEKEFITNLLLKQGYDEL